MTFCEDRESEKIESAGKWNLLPIVDVEKMPGEHQERGKSPHMVQPYELLTRR